MSIFLSAQEKTLINQQRGQDPVNRFFWALRRRVQKRAESPGLINFDTSVHWWHACAEYTTDAAMVYALAPEPQVGAWLRDVVLSLIRRPVADWVGPWFRNHTLQPPVGNLETAHLTLAVAATLDLAPEVFTAAERDEISLHLREVAMPLCRRWLSDRTSLNNWWAVMTFGVASAAAVLNDEAMLQAAVDYFKVGVQAFQPDGSHSESLQYGNYAAQALMLTYESLIRRNPDLQTDISPLRYARGVPWSIYSHFYTKPLSGWGATPMPRSANFNDSAAVHRPTADVLLHIAVRTQAELPLEAGLARWLFNKLYLPLVDQPPTDLMSFGFFNQFGFLTLPLLVQAPAAIAPEAAGLPPQRHFSCGDTIVRQTWQSPTVLAIHGGGDPLCGPGHLHGDLNSFILVHNRERLLLDPGHACYRNLHRELDISSQTHNTCTFTFDAPEVTRPDDLPRATVLQQSTNLRRPMRDGQPGAPVDRGGRHLLDAKAGLLTVVASDAGALYGPPLHSFKRFFALCGEHALFIIDHIEAERPVRPTWHWLLNNRDGQLDWKPVPPDRLVARRGDAGLKLFHLGGGNFQGPVYAHVHDAYHPQPGQPSEGRAGSGMLFRWQAGVARTRFNVVHAIAVDHYGAIGGWHLRQAGNRIGLESPGAAQTWWLSLQDAPWKFTLEAADGTLQAQVVQVDDTWHLIDQLTV